MSFIDDIVIGERYPGLATVGVEELIRRRFPTPRQDTLPESFTRQQKADVILREELPVQGGLFTALTSSVIGKTKQIFGGDDIYSVPIHGRWTGPLFSGNKRMKKGDLLTREDLEVNATDDLDEISKAHDIQYAVAASFKDEELRKKAYQSADRIYTEKVRALKTNWFGLTFDTIMTVINLYMTYQSIANLYSTVMEASIINSDIKLSSQEIAMIEQNIKDNAEQREGIENRIRDLLNNRDQYAENINRFNTQLQELEQAMMQNTEDIVSSNRRIIELGNQKDIFTGEKQKLIRDYEAAIDSIQDKRREFQEYLNPLRDVVEAERIELPGQFDLRKNEQYLLKIRIASENAQKQLTHLKKFKDFDEYSFWEKQRLDDKIRNLNETIREFRNVQSKIFAAESSIERFGANAAIIENTIKDKEGAIALKEAQLRIMRERELLQIDDYMRLTREIELNKDNLLRDREMINDILNVKIPRQELNLEILNKGLETYSERLNYYNEMYKEYQVEANEKFLELSKSLPVSIEQISGASDRYVASLAGFAAAKIFGERLQSGDDKYYVYQETPQNLVEEYINKLKQIDESNFVNEIYPTVTPSIGFLQPSIEESIYSPPQLVERPVKLIEQPSIEESVYSTPNVPLTPLTIPPPPTMPIPPSVLPLPIDKDLLLAALEILL